jgi:hypothetical protein
MSWNTGIYSGTGAFEPFLLGQDFADGLEVANGVMQGIVMCRHFLLVELALPVISTKASI